MGAVDLVIQVESPTSVARGLQRIGRAGHQVGEPSKGVIFPKYRGDLLETAVVVKGMHDGAIEQTTLPRNPLDVLAQQIVAITVGERLTVDELLALARRAAPFETLTREVLEGVLGMLAGAYPSRRVRRAQAARRLGPGHRRRRGAPRRARRRRHERRHDPGPRPVPRVPRGRGRDARPARRRARRGDGLRAAGRDARRRRRPRRELAGASQDISPNRVTVTPAPGVPGKLPFWHGDAVGRPVELGRADRRVHRARSRRTSRRGAKGRAKAGRPAARRPRPRRPRGREPARRTSRTSATRPARCPRTAGSSSSASATSSATGGSSILTPFGGRVHAPWTLALEARLQERLGLEVQTIYSDDGIAIRLPEGDATPRRRRGAAVPGPRGGRGPRRRAGRPVEPVREPVPRERRPGAAPAAAPARHADARCGSSASAPRTCSPSPAATGASRSSSRRTASASPTCSTCRPCARCSAASRGARSPSTASRPRRRRRSPGSLLFDYVAAYMYDGDAPLAERRAQALTLDRDLLRELLGQEELRELLDPDALADLELSLQALAEERHATNRRPGPRPAAAARRPDAWTRPGRGPRAGGSRRRSTSPSSRRRGARSGRGSRGEERWIAMEDVARYRDGVGVERAAGRAAGVPRRRSSGRSTGCSPGGRAPTARSWPPSRRAAGACPVGVVDDALHRLVAAGSLLSGEFRPGGAERELLRPGGPAAAPPAVARASSGARWSRSTRSRSPGSCPRGRASRPSPSRGRGRRAAPRLGGPGAARRGRRPARRPADPGLGPRARRAARPASPATSRGCSTSWARWARSPGRGGGASGRDDGRVVLLPARPRAAPARPACPTASSARRASSTSGSARTSAAAAPVLPRAVHRVARPVGPRGARRAVGPRLGGRGHQRHVRAAAGAALEAAGEGPRGRGPSRLTSLGPPEAAGRWSLVDERRLGRRCRRRATGWPMTGPAPAAADPHRARPCPGARPARAPRRADPRGGRRRGGRRRVQRGLPGPPRARGGRAGSGAATSSTGSGAAQFALPGRRGPAAGDARPAGRARGRARARRPPARRRRSGEPVRRGARRGRAATRPTAGRSSARPAPTSCSSTARPSCTWTAAAPRSRRSPPPTTRSALAIALRRARATSSRTGGSASW